MGFTQEQQSAIDTRNKTLLVSAGAGAGKTTTLTNRIITSLLDREHPADISRMLVITYTKASAADLRAHIRDALKKACEAHPEDSRLAEQLSALPSAQISTVDSFFYKLLKEHSAEAGVSPYVRMADDAEQTILMHDIMNRLVLRLYEGEEPAICTAEQFCQLAEMLTEPKEETAITDVFLHLYRICANYPERTGYLEQLANNQISQSQSPPEQTVWGQYILWQTAEICRSAIAYLSKSAERAMSEEAENIPALTKVLEGDVAILENIIACTNISFAKARQAVTAFSPPTLRPKVKDLEALEAFKAVRKTYKVTVKNYCERFFAFPPSAWEEALLQTGEYTLLACRVVEGFTRQYENEKNRRRICDFGDLEHKLCALLYTEGKPNQIAQAIARDYDYVYVDEYQDINRMQHEIIEAVSRPDNRFMVGDIKQSIYSFRRAEPTLFASMKKTFPHLSEAGDSQTASVFLSENFRSTAKTIAGINRIFDFLFCHAGDSIGYEERERLVCGNNIEGEAFPTAVLCYRANLDTEAKGTVTQSEETEIAPIAIETDSGEDIEATEEEEEQEEDNAENKPIHEEARYVAREIKRLLSLKKEDGTPRYVPGDIAILLRSLKKKGNHYARALTEAGIGVALADAKDFFLVPEVLLCLCLLNAVDNPQKDIYLAGLMQSPLYGFTQDDLTNIRLETGVDMPLYYSLTAYAEKYPHHEGCNRLLSDLRRYRTLSECVPVDRLVRRMFDETGLLSLAKGGGGGRDNLLLLYHYARTFEGSDFKGLHAFIDYLNQIIQTNNTIKTPARSVAEPDKVRIMTIHSSKGLEFPVSFVCGTMSAFNELDLREKTLFHPSFGLAFALRDKTGFVSLNTPMLEVTKEAMRQSSREEEMRVLYVALTRAKERLYITARAPKNNAVNTVMQKIQCMRDAPTAWSILQANNHFLMVASGMGREQIAIEMPENAVGEKEGQTLDLTEIQPDPALYQELERRFGFVYPYSYLHRIPGKIAVSKLTPAVLDGTEEEMPDLARAKEGQILPSFYSAEQVHTPAERGTATHLFMQFCDFDKLANIGANAELKRLTAEGYMEQATAELVRVEELERFRKSPLFARILEAKAIKREFRFHVRLPASDYTQDGELKERLAGESILVQGVIDSMLFDKDGNITLIDYKTDRLTKEELANPTLARQKLFDRHFEQVKYYALAVAEIFGQPPKHIGLYSLHAGQVFWAEEYCNTSLS